MKKVFLPFWLLVLCGFAHGQGTVYTTNRNLALPPAAPGTWGEQYNNNFQELDISKIPRVTNATKPTSPTVNTVIVITDAANGSTCSTGGGSVQNVCQWNGTSWTIIGGSGTVGSASNFDSSVAFTADITPAQIVANTDDYAGCTLATNAVCRISTDASRNITGFLGGSDGKLLFLYNVGSFNAVLKNLTTSSAINQLTINADITIAPNQGIILQYDSTSTKWRAASGISGGGAGQAADNDLTALAGFSSTGFPARTGTDTWAQRAMASGDVLNVVITNPLGVAGDPTWNVGPNVALTTRSFTATTGDFDLGNSLSFTFPKAPGAAPSTEGRCAQDTTSHRLKCNFGSGVVTVAISGDYQPLNGNLTGIAGLTTANNAVPIFTAAGGAAVSAILPSCPDSGGNHINFDATLHTWTCGTSSTGGLSGLTTNKFLMATSATTADTSGNLSQSAGVVNASGGLTIGDVSTNYILVDPAAVTGAKTWTAINFSGTIRPSTGVITAGHVLTVDANGLIVDGGVAGAGTWTDASTNTGTNKTLRDTLAGGTNTLYTPLRASFDAGSLTTNEDVSFCGTATRTVINSGPAIYTFVCTDNNSSTFDGHLTLPITMAGNLGTVKFRLTVNDVDSSAQVFAGGFKAMCRASGTLVDGTWGTAQTVAITMTTANTDYSQTTAAVTPNGTCSAGSELFWRFTVDATTNTDDGDARVIGVFMEQAS